MILELCRILLSRESAWWGRVGQGTETSHRCHSKIRRGAEYSEGRAVPGPGSEHFL